MDETRQILDMLAEGAITTEQAAELLDALDASDAPQTTGPALQWETPGRSVAPRPDVATYIRAAQHGVTSEYIRDMRGLLGQHLTVDELIELSIYGVTREYVEDLSREGLEGLTVADLIELAKYGAGADVVRAIREAGAGVQQR